jgi:glycosyltransferase involved in cell wall biosynthesis
MKTPEISIIIPVYNTGNYLSRCLNSIFAQTFSNFECILVDDCSTDSSPVQCDEYARKDTRIKVIHNKTNKGCPQSRKEGFGVASGNYILFVDSDDWIEENMLEIMYNKAVGENLDMVYCGLFINSEYKQKQYDNPLLENKIEMIKQILVWGKFCPSVWNKLIKRGIYERIIFPTANYGEDRPICIQAIYYSRNIGFVNNFLYHYYQNVNSICFDNSRFLKKYIDEYENTLWSINFINDNFPSHFFLFEPELSNYINSVKLHFILEKPIRDLSKLHNLYPDSINHIFNKSWHENFFNKIFLKLVINDFPFIFILIDVFYTLLYILKKAYRIIIPSKIRAFIWQKRTGGLLS